MQRNTYISTAAAVVLMVGGPVAAAAAATSGAAGTPSAATAAVRADVDATGAAEAAVKHYPGTVVSLDKDGAVWHVDVVGKNGKHAELTVDTRSGKVFTEHADGDDDGDNAQEKKQLLAAKINAQKAVKAALAAHPGQVRSVDWDDDNGGARYWDVEIQPKGGGATKHVHVDATTGKATVSSSDSDSDDDNDNDNDS
ncbi:PepSY domain-containing protein [Streptomyces goshikiensis]|uniref:PepSY domain-containing protein n=1 Tax=Streptomyces goshikiensis TaxID=1942 RepID=UPI002E12F4BE|nr:PepSY domain-containing protein [Streptomyces goshikiensis]